MTGIENMGKFELAFYQAVKSKGQIYHYYRRKGRRYRISGEPGTIEFAASYEAIHKSFEDTVGGFPAGSIGALIAEYRASPDWMQLKPKTRIGYERYLAIICDEWGRRLASGMQRKHVLRLRDQYQDKPTTANHLVSTVSLLMTFGIDREYATSNPAAKPRRLKTGPGYRAWSDNEINALMRNADQEIVDISMVALYTGQRQGDVMAMRWDQITDGMIEVTQAKTGQTVWIPIHPILVARLEGIKRRSVRSAVHVCTTAYGRPWKKSNLQLRFKAATRALGFEVQFHGLRKTAARMLSEAGCTTEQIKAVTGHTTDEMVAHYVRDSDRKKNAQAAINKLQVANFSDKNGKLSKLDNS